MKKVLYLRHGQSETNLRGVFAGGKDDTPLTDLGREQAKIAGQKLRSETIDRIITSPLSRTLETARIIAREIGFDEQAIQVEPRLQEYDIGDGNGLSQAGMTAKIMMSLANIEDPELFATRVMGALEPIAQFEGTTLIIGHGGVGRVIECLRTGRNPAEFYDLPGYPNAEAVELELNWLRS